VTDLYPDGANAVHGMSHAAIALIVIGGVLQVLGIVLTAVQLYRVRGKYLRWSGGKRQLTVRHLETFGEALDDLASGGWKWGIASVSLIVVGIILTTVGAIVQ